MASELSKFIDDELARANIEGGQETESLIKERKREALVWTDFNLPPLPCLPVPVGFSQRK